MSSKIEKMKTTGIRQIFFLISLIIVPNVVFSQKRTHAFRSHDTVKRLTDSSSTLHVGNAIKSIKPYIDTSKNNEILTRQVKNSQSSSERNQIIKATSKEVFVDLLGHAFWALITLLLGYLSLKIGKWIVNRKYKKIFGNDIKDYSIIYPNFQLTTVYDAHGNIVQFPYMKNNVVNFRMSSPVSLTDMKSAQYISDAFYSKTSKSPKIIPDSDVATKLNFSYCSIGGTGNDKTNDILSAPNNRFFDFNLAQIPQGIQRKLDNAMHFPSATDDLGVILRITSKNFPKRIHICVSGLGESGTSGSAWFLAMKWRQLLKRSKGRDFGAVIRTRAGTDESAEIIDFVVNKK
jgi:hypothetical protein